MAGGCCGGCEPTPATHDKIWRRVLWISLAINAGMFALEIAAGVSAQSAALKADALDFLGDSANYAISLGVAGLALQWRARAALLKGVSLLVLGLWVLGSTVWMAVAGTLPAAETMGVIGALALIANLTCAVMLWKHREGDANRRSVWICSRNDAVGNIAVVAAALGVFGTGTAWPDIVVATILAGLGVSGGWQIVSQAYSELRSVKSKSEVPTGRHIGVPSAPRRGVIPPML